MSDHARGYRRPVERFFAKVRPAGDESGCLLWTGAVSSGTTARGGGYGQFWVENRAYPAHRWLMMRAHPTLAEGLEVDHLCRNRLCVRPSHLEIVTKSENVRRGNAARRAEVRA